MKLSPSVNKTHICTENYKCNEKAALHLMLWTLELFQIAEKQSPLYVVMERVHFIMGKRFLDREGG